MDALNSPHRADSRSRGHRPEAKKTAETREHSVHHLVVPALDLVVALHLVVDVYKRQTVDINKFGLQPRWVKSRSASSDIQVARMDTDRSPDQGRSDIPAPHVVPDVYKRQDRKWIGRRGFLTGH